MGKSDIESITDPEVVFASWLERFGHMIESRDGEALGKLFAQDSYWKDVLAFTWEYRTFAGPAQVATAFAASAERVAPRNVRIAAGRSAPRLLRRAGRLCIEGYFDFDDAVGAGAGFVRLLHDPEQPMQPMIWLLLTSQHNVRGHEERIGERRPTGEQYSQIVSPDSWRDVRETEKSYVDRDPQVVVVGAGQAGLMAAARLRQMGADTLVIEKSPRVGDVWRNRYNNLTLHNEIFANHFPYFPFPETWPLWLPKDMLGAWLEAYAEFMELNVWTGTTITQAKFSPATQDWGLVLTRADGSTRELRCKHLVIATGVSGGAPKMPQLPGLDTFRGKVVHSNQFRTGVEWSGRNALVIGTGNSGHDVAQDLYVSGAKVSLMQRGPTCVVSLDPGARITYAIFAEGRPVEDTDLMTAAIPYPVLIDTYKGVTRRTNEHDRELLEKLRAVGFRTTDGIDDTGFQLIYLRGLGGYYIDVGCCKLVAERKIPLIQAEDYERFVPEGIRLRDGTVVPLDLIVLATGFDGMQESVRALVGDEIAERVGPAWGFDRDHVMRNMWRRTAQEGLWLMGGSIIEARLYSRFLAVEIIASLEGVLPERSAMPLVERPPVHTPSPEPSECAS